MHRKRWRRLLLYCLSILQFSIRGTYYCRPATWFGRNQWESPNRTVTATVSGIGQRELAAAWGAPGGGIRADWAANICGLDFSRIKCDANSKPKTRRAGSVAVCPKMPDHCQITSTDCAPPISVQTNTPDSFSVAGRVWGCSIRADVGRDIGCHFVGVVGRDDADDAGMPGGRMRARYRRAANPMENRGHVCLSWPACPLPWLPFGAVGTPGC